MQRSISNYINTYGTIVLLFWINVRNTVNEAIAWWQSNTKQHSHLIDGLLLLSFVEPFSIVYIIDQSISSSFFATFETAYILVSPLWKKVLPWYNNCCRYSRYFKESVFVKNFSVNRGYRKHIKKWYTINVKTMILAENDTNKIGVKEFAIYFECFALHPFRVLF